MGTWHNGDGLYIKYGQDEITVTDTGEFNTSGRDHEIESVITLTGLGTAAAIQNDTVVVPSGARISRVIVENEVAATSGGSAVLNVGLIDQDRATELDYDGLVAALALASFNTVGEQVELVVGSTGAGALIGTTLTNAGLITADYDTAAFTAGKVRIRIFYYIP